MATEISPLEYRGAVDNGPQDGVFDVFAAPLNDHVINNNGFQQRRGAMEFDLSGIPGNRLDSATLTLRTTLFEGPRSFAVHGYVGDGTVALEDFALDGLIETRNLQPIGGQTLSFDVTDFIGSLLSNGDPIAGFNLREEPANASNFTVIRVTLTPSELAPKLLVESSTVEVPALGVAELTILGLILLISAMRLLRRQVAKLGGDH